LTVLVDYEKFQVD